MASSQIGRALSRLFLAAVLAPSFAQASDDIIPVGKVATEEAKAPFISCVTQSGLPVQFTHRRGQSLSAIRAVVRDEVDENGETQTVARILYDERFLASLPEESQLFLMAHECAHHALGHTEDFNPGVSKFQIRQYEIEADEWAVQKMYEMGYDTAAIVRGMEVIANETDTGTHPSGRERIARAEAQLRELDADAPAVIGSIAKRFAIGLG